MRDTVLWKNKMTGACVVDKAAFDVLPFSLLTDPPNNSIAVSALQQAGPYTMTVTKEGPVVVRKLSMESTASGVSNATVALSFQDGSGPGQPLMNAPCHINTIFGSNLQPYYLPQGLFMPENWALNAFLYDLSGSTNTIYLNAGCKRLRKAVQDPDGKLARERMLRRQYISFPYFYTFDDGLMSLTGSGTGTKTMSMDSKDSFEVHQISFVSTGDFNINIYNQSTGDSIISAAGGGGAYQIPNTLLCGDGNFPFRLHEPWMIGPGQKLIIDMTDTSGSTNNVYLTIGGVNYRTGEQR